MPSSAATNSMPNANVNPVSHNVFANPNITSPADNLNKITVEQLHDVIDSATDDNNNVDNNNSNQESDPYYCTHNTIIALDNTNTTIRHTPTKLLIDYGVSHTMINNKHYFIDFNPWNSSHSVTLADGQTKAQILGHGTIQAFTSNGSLLATKAFSLLPNHNIHTKNGITTLSFPQFTITTDDNIEDPLIYIIMNPFPLAPTAAHLVPPETPLPTITPQPDDTELIAKDSPDNKINNEKTNQNSTKVTDNIESSLTKSIPLLLYQHGSKRNSELLSEIKMVQSIGG